MNLEIQIQSITISVLYGLFVSLTFNIMYQFIFKSKNIIRWVVTMVYIFIILTLYFILMMLVNNGIIHGYFLISLISGFLIGNKTTKKMRYKFEIIKFYKN